MSHVDEDPMAPKKKIAPRGPDPDRIVVHGNAEEFRDYVRNALVGCDTHDVLVTLKIAYSTDDACLSTDRDELVEQALELCHWTTVAGQLPSERPAWLRLKGEAS